MDWNYMVSGQRQAILRATFFWNNLLKNILFLAWFQSTSTFTIPSSILLLVCLLSTTSEAAPKVRPRFIAIPLEDVQLVEVEDIPGTKLPSTASHMRAPRDVNAHLRGNQGTGNEDAARIERQAGHDHHHHEYVDFGAHTGHHGSFGWYADFPVQDPGHWSDKKN